MKRLKEQTTIRVLRGERAILNVRGLLVGLAERSGQAEVTSDLHYFLRKPGLLKRIPVLLLICRPGTASEVKAVSVEDLVGGVLLFDYGVVRLSARMYTSNDRSGRRTILAPPAERARVAACASEYLLAAGAHLVMFSFRSDPSDLTRALLTRSTPRSSWTVRQRNIRDYLSLRSSFEETLASIGKRTRTHLRYYRRKAEGKLGCSFEPAAKISLQEMLAFNRECMFAVAEPVARWRLAALEEFEDPILMGTRDADFKWLSLLGGRRQNGETEILWQMNRRDLPAYSLTTVMRSYLIEQEVKLGTQRLYFEGGSGHSLCHSFVTATVTDLAVLRRSLLTSLARKFVRRFIPRDNALAHLLLEDVRSPSPDPIAEANPVSPTLPRRRPSIMSLLSRVGSFVSWQIRWTEDWWFDTWNRVDTRGDGTWHRATDNVGPLRDGHMYLPARARNVRSSLRAMPLSELADYTFIDMGSGKGRVVLLAAELPFKRVVGVEYSTSLDQQARVNLQARRKNADGCKHLELKHADAASYVFPGGNLVIYLFNPFGPDVMSHMLRNLQSSFEAEPRHVVLILLWPELSAMVAKVPGMRLYRRTRRYEIFEMQPIHLR